MKRCPDANNRENRPASGYTITATTCRSRLTSTWIATTMAAKFWLTPVALAYNIGFRARELRDIQRIVSERSAEFLEAWNDYFGT